MDKKEMDKYVKKYNITIEKTYNPDKESMDKARRILAHWMLDEYNKEKDKEGMNNMNKE